MSASDKNKETKVVKEVELPQVQGPVEDTTKGPVDAEPAKLQPAHLFKIQDSQTKTEEFKTRKFEVYQLEKQIAMLQSQMKAKSESLDKDYDDHVKAMQSLNEEMYRTYGGNIRILSNEGHFEVIEQQ